ncbi:MAG: hypothetical protein RLZZ126_1644 [Pseudomonadota bacterium]|jgi:protein TonB
MSNRKVSRDGLVVAAVLLLHVAALWALQTGLLRRATEVVLPVALLSEWISPPAPKVAEPPPTPTPSRQQTLKRQGQPPVPPAPVAAPDPMPAPPNAVTGPATPQPSPAPVAAAVAAAALPTAAAAPALPTPARIELPSSDADYLQNPKPVYPRLSKTLGEQGQVLLRVLVGIDGRPQQIHLRQSSGHERLDQAATQAVAQWRFVPGKRNGVPEAMWYVVPVSFELK